ncbi:MAG: FkbM family methyltransferase [Lentilitoribacter sp.]
MTTLRNKITKAEALLSEAFAEYSAALKQNTGSERGALNQECWNLRLMTGELREYFSQSGQDWFVDRMLTKSKEGGVFVDVGGFDGVTGSNTLFFETFRRWTGVLIEGVDENLERAINIRRCPCIGTVVTGDGAPVEFLEVTSGYRQMSGRLDTYDPNLLAQVRAHPKHKETVRTVPTRTLVSILQEFDITEVDYLSLDIEGAEQDILESFPFDRIQIEFLSIENPTASQSTSDFMRSKGFKLKEFLGADQIYCRM